MGRNITKALLGENFFIYNDMYREKETYRSRKALAENLPILPTDFSPKRRKLLILKEFFVKF